MATVRVFDEDKAKQELKKCPKIVRDYVKLLIEAYDRQKALTGRAIKKIEELSTNTSND